MTTPTPNFGWRTLEPTLNGGVQLGLCKGLSAEVVRTEYCPERSCLTDLDDCCISPDGWSVSLRCSGISSINLERGLKLGCPSSDRHDGGADRGRQVDGDGGQPWSGCAPRPRDGRTGLPDRGGFRRTRRTP